jgi:hypothetical protein
MSKLTKVCGRETQSPILSNFIVDMLAILISIAKEDGRVGGFIPHLVGGGCGGSRMKFVGVPSLKTSILSFVFKHN